MRSTDASRALDCGASAKERRAQSVEGRYLNGGHRRNLAIGAGIAKDRNPSGGCCVRNQDFRQIRLLLADQGVTFAVRYDRNLLRKTWMRAGNSGH